ncbi:MAG TPA: fumarylacetoacetate hydrolase family protein [Anaeromyxobacteraceae bacterium]|nr:fumarylacetoacetate hydrolase family protein [Anaeromyxobacteraceae bacterium]
MRYVRYRRAGQERHGQLEGDQVRPLTAAPWLGGTPEGAPVPLADVQLLAPVQPSKIVCVGRNYMAHAREMGWEVPKEPLIFLKPSTSVVGPGDEIRCPPQSREVHYEAELGVVVGRTLTRVSPSEARLGVLGWTCVNDVTARDIQKAEKQFTRAKGFDTFCPVGPWIETNLDPLEVSVVCRVNGEERQRGYPKDMAFDPFYVASFVSHVMTLLPGDVIATGTPEGVGAIQRGDWVEVEVSGIGVLKNPVV